MSGRHRQQIADAHGLQVRARLRGRFVGEELEDRVVDAQLPFRNGEADGGRREALAQREHLVRLVGGVRRPPSLGHDLPVAHDHQAVESVERPFGLLDEREDRRRRDALAFRGGTRKREWRIGRRTEARDQTHDGRNENVSHEHSSRFETAA
jgi:hypothetical protein